MSEKAHIFPYCVSNQKSVVLVDGKDSDCQIQCFPIYAILNASETSILDYLQLSTDGHELAILTTIPWEKVIFIVHIIMYIPKWQFYDCFVIVVIVACI